MKSPPELWAELQGDRLPAALGGGTVRPTEPERTLEWQAGGARGTARLEQSGWGTKVTITAEVEDEVRRLEPEVANLGLWDRLMGAPPPPSEPPRRERIEQALNGLLDELGSAHKKPFQGG